MREASVSTLAELVGGEVIGDGEALVSNIANIAQAKTGDISFLNSDQYVAFLDNTTASAVILNEKYARDCNAALIVVNDPYLAYAKIATYLTQLEAAKGGVHATAVVSDAANIHESACIGANVLIEAGVTIGQSVVIEANCFIGQNVSIGNNTTLKANVSIYANTQLGERVQIHCGSVLGSDGFGLANENGAWVKIPQLGKLIIGNDVEIGANCSIDRGAIDDTIIRDGVKIDNLVHIAHNVEIGEHTAIAGCVGIAGSTKIGKHCTIAGAAALTGHIELADNVHIGGMGMVTKSFKEPGHYSSGIPADDTKKWRKNVVRFRQMEKLEKRIKDLENELKLLKGS